MARRKTTTAALRRTVKARLDKQRAVAKTNATKTAKAAKSLTRDSSASELLVATTVQTRRAAQAARADVKQAKKLLRRIRQDFYDVGEILTRLKKPARYKALRYGSFAELVRGEFDMSPSVANRLVAIVENVSRELALEVGQSHAFALVRLAQATAEDDTPDELATRTLELPSGDTLHVPSASVRAKKAAASAIRRARGTPKRGNMATPEERAIAKEIEASLRALGVKKAKVRAKPTRPGDSAELELRGVPMSSLGELCRAICPG